VAIIFTLLSGISAREWALAFMRVTNWVKSVILLDRGPAESPFSLTAIPCALVACKVE